MKNLFLLLCLSTFAAKGQITPPYFNDFENGAQGWFDSTYSGSSWELGTPNFGLTTGAHSGSNAWDISLDSAYNDSTLCYLYSPHFNFSTSTNSILSFWLNYKIEVQWDGALLQYSTDSGTTWKILGFNDNIPTINWNSNNVVGDWGWSGTSNCWAFSAIKLDSVYGFSDVQFRFRFSSDASIFYDGITIDDFSIYTLPNNDASIASIISPSKNTQQPFNVATANVANVGSNTLLSIPVGVIINGGTPFFSIYNGSLTSIKADSFSMGNFTAPNGYYTICFFTQLPGDTNPLNDTLCCEINNGVSSVSASDNSSFVIYPNPSGNNLIRISNLNTTGMFSVCIIDGIGNTVYTSQKASNHSHIINKKLAAGIYFVLIAEGDKLYYKKLIVN
jgi:hypothetical protein